MTTTQDMTNNTYMENVISTMLDAKLKPLLDMQQQLINQNLKLSEQLLNRPAIASAPPSSSSTPPRPPVRTTSYSNESSDGVKIAKNPNGRYYVTGKTFDIKDTIKELGADWSKSDKHWLFNDGVTESQIRTKLGTVCKVQA
jgi:hypothetical protein